MLCIKFHILLRLFKNFRCWGHLGRVGGESKISVGDACEFKNIMAHEIGHAIGFFHEHNRMDRDKYVKIEWDNVNECEYKLEKGKLEDLTYL